MECDAGTDWVLTIFASIGGAAVAIVVGCLLGYLGTKWL